MSTHEDIFNTSALSAREQVTEWFNLKEKLGNRIAGKFLGFWINPARGKFRQQVGIALQDFDDPSKVVGINLPEYFEDTVAVYRIGDRVGAEYYKDIPAKEAGMSATKATRLFNPDKVEREKRGEHTQPTKGIVVENKDTDPNAEEDLGF